MIIGKYGKMKKITDQNEEYRQQRELINAEEIGVTLEQQIKKRTSSYSNIFDKF